MAIGAKYWSQNVFSRKNDVQSLLMTDGTLKLDYASVKFVNPPVQIFNKFFWHPTFLLQLLCARYKVSASP